MVDCDKVLFERLFAELTKVFTEDLDDAVKVFEDHQGRDLHLNICKEVHLVLLHMKKVVLWCCDNWRNFFAVRIFLNFSPEYVAACPAHGASVVLFNDDFAGKSEIWHRSKKTTRKDDLINQRQLAYPAGVMTKKLCIMVLLLLT